MTEQTTNLAKEKTPLRPRFISFEPKAADFAEFTRGKLKQDAQIQVLANAAEPVKNPLLSGEGSLTYSEEFVRELKDAIQRQATGLDDKGQTFFAEYRSINAIRIGGTYNFDLMLEVPACGRDTKSGLSYKSDPVAKEIKADIYLVGVIRHVYDRGETGLIFLNPETENDHVYEQVVLKVYSGELLWEFNGVPWQRKYQQKKPTFTLNVVSNHEEARFVVKRERKDKGTYQTISEVIGDGSGNKAEIALPIEKDPYSARVEFLPVVDTSATSGPVVLKATASPSEFIVKDSDTQTVVGGYTSEVTVGR